MPARHSGHELFRKGGLHVSERTRFESFLILYYILLSLRDHPYITFAKGLGGCGQKDNLPMPARHSGHELFRKGGLHVSERTRFESFLISYYYYYPYSTFGRTHWKLVGLRVNFSLENGENINQKRQLCWNACSPFRSEKVQKCADVI